MTEEKTGTTSSEERAERLARVKNLALVTAVIGFSVQVVGTFIGHAQMTQIGMGMFLFSIPTFLITFFLSRRRQEPPPQPVVQKGPARRRPRRKKK